MTDPNGEFKLTAADVALKQNGFRYCPYCRTELVEREVFGRVRRVCPDPDCRFVQFLDPKVGAAVLAEQDGKVLLIKRSVEPALGSWCLPGGFIEQGETPTAAAVRECKEESGFDVVITGLIDVFYYESFRGSGVLIVYKGQIVGGAAEPNDDAEAVAFFGPDELPDNIEFESNVRTLAAWRQGNI
jgi:ADP-ribose pyrophosphatase YjhB (NUDIX family)